MRSSTPAWLFDAYPHPRRSSLVVWARQGSSTTKRHVPYQPEFCLKADQLPLEEAERRLAEDPRVESTRRDHTRLWLRGPLHEVLKVKPRRFQDTWGVATDLRKATRTKGFLFFDVDHGQESRWMHERGLFSLCRLKAGPHGPELELADEEKPDAPGAKGVPGRWRIDYPDLGLRTLHLDVRARQVGHVPALTDPLESIQLGDEVLECPKPGEGDEESERATLRELGRLLHRKDPDVLTTDGGDGFHLPWLLQRIAGLGLRERVWLGRDPDPFPDRPDQAGKSIHTYGRWLYKTPAWYLRGRWHVDLSKKMLDSEAARTDLHGIVYLTRTSNRRAQDVARNGAGFALQQMQVDLATDRGVALPWKRNLTEDWKDAATLCAVDRGGQIMVPEAGVHEDVAACDFSGFYPSLVVAHNLSSDSMNCTCCPDAPFVPELDYHVCQRHKADPPEYGHQAEILRRLEEHRRRAKGILKRAKAAGRGEVDPVTGQPIVVDPVEVAKAKALKSEHKAIGVVCFGYFRYRNARFGCAEVHQAIQCYGRAGMTRVRELAQEDGFAMVHALTDCAFLQRKGITRAQAMRFANRVFREVGVPMEVEGVYRWLVLLPSKTHSSSSSVGVPNRYYGKFEDGTLKVRGIEVQRHSTPPFIEDVQRAMLAVLAEADDAEGFLARVPLALRVAKQAAGRLLAREVPTSELAVLVQATKSVEEYRASTATKAALKRLRSAGTERKPGEYVRYVHTRGVGPWESRAQPAELMGEPSPWFADAGGAYDAEAYLRLLARSVETLLAPFGYEEEGVLAWFQGKSKRPERMPGPKEPRPGTLAAYW